MRLLDFSTARRRRSARAAFRRWRRPGSTVAGLTGLLTLFVALIGYRLLFGHTPACATACWLVKIGVVLALATSWPAFQALVYAWPSRARPSSPPMSCRPPALPAENLDFPIQQAYDVLRIGIQERAVSATDGKSGTAAADADHRLGAGDVDRGPVRGAPRRDRISACGRSARAGELLFSGAIGLFNGWLRAWAGWRWPRRIDLVTAAELTMIESELGACRR